MPKKIENPYVLAAKAELERRKRDGKLEPPEPLWKPNRGKGDKKNPQQLAMESEADELFFGGSPGGGKTDLILGLGVTQHRNTVIFRRELQQMKGAEGIIARSKEIIGNNGRFNATDNVWRKIEGFRTLEFAGIKNDEDRTKQQGRARDLFAFDEITEFPEAVYTFVIAWNRTKHKDQRCRVVCVGNPPTTPEGQWVTRRWAAWLDRKHPNPAKPGELRWYAMVNGKDTEMPDHRDFVIVDGKPIYDFNPNDFSPIEIISPKSRTFIPSSVMDNPHLLNTGYIATIQRLPEPLRTIMLDPEKGFNMVIKDDLWQVIPTVWVMNAIERGKLTPKPINQPLSAIGVDPSRGGDDEFIIAKRYGAWYAPLVSYPGSEVPDGQTGANLVIREIDPDSDPIINIDVIGVGSSPRDFLIEYNAASEINDVNFAEGSQSFDETGKFKMANVRAECYWGMREALNPEKGDDLCLPDDDILKADLCASRYKITTRGIVIESKDEIRERIGRSPDRGDAVVLARYLDITEAESLYYGAF